jgi:predicted dithiol-disulfide oxidoreductase (DUF899 family)
MEIAADREAWLAARKALLDREKALTRLRDEVAAERRKLPWRAVDKDYRFAGARGALALADLFGGRGQLIVYHFMLAPGGKPCPSCSFWAEHYDGARVHLRQRDTELAVVSRAPYEEIDAVKARMGWRFPWVSSFGSDFNADFGVTHTAGQDGQPLYNFGTQKAWAGEAPGLSVFARQGDAVFHTYSAYSRGLDALNMTYQLLDLTPKGRDEDSLPWPMAWVRLKDEYPQP